MHQLIILIAKYAIVFPVIAGIYVFIRQTSKTRGRFMAYALLSAVCAGILMKIMASLHQDPRPFVRDGVLPYFKHAPDNGFPSDHTVLSSLAAFIVLPYYRKLGAALLVVALLIGSSRVVAGIHHGQDIAGGFLAALVGAVIAWYAVKFVVRFRTQERHADSISEE